MSWILLVWSQVQGCAGRLKHAKLLAPSIAQMPVIAGQMVLLVFRQLWLIVTQSSRSVFAMTASFATLIPGGVRKIPVRTTSSEMVNVSTIARLLAPWTAQLPNNAGQIMLLVFRQLWLIATQSSRSVFAMTASFATLIPDGVRKIPVRTTSSEMVNVSTIVPPSSLPSSSLCSSPPPELLTSTLGRMD